MDMSSNGKSRLQKLKTRNPFRWQTAMLVIFLLSHAGYYAAGVRFDTSSLDWAWQFLDIDLLRHHLCQSVWYMHCQPPFFNLFLGAVLKAAPVHFSVVFQLIYLVLGFLLYLSMFSLMRWLGVRSILSFASSTLFVLSPSFVLYEQWLFYSFPVTAILTCSLVFLYRFLEKRGAWDAFAFFGCLLLLCGIWALFHPLFFILVALGLCARIFEGRRILLTSACATGGLLLLILLKNMALFGHPVMSTWGGMDLDISSTQMLSAEIRGQMMASGSLSPLALVIPFSPIKDFPSQYQTYNRYPLVDALHQVNKSTGGINFNNGCYVKIADACLHDALSGIAAHPGCLFKGIWRGVQYISLSTSQDMLLGKNRRTLRTLTLFWDVCVYGRLQTRSCVYVALVYPSVIIFCLWLCTAGWRDKSEKGEQRRTMLGFICFTVLWISILPLLVNSVENNRIRFTTDPLLVILLSVTCQELWTRFRERCGVFRQELHRGQRLSPLRDLL
jgi:hypothetical protein